MESALEKQLRIRDDKKKEIENIPEKEAQRIVRPKGDTNRIPGQNFVVLTYAAPKNSKLKSENICVKISGIFPTSKEAKAQAEILHKEDDRLDIHIISAYEWVTIPILEELEPFVRKHYTDNRLDEIMKEKYLINKKSKKQMSDRISKEKEAAEKRMQEVYGPTYKMKPKPESVLQYEKETIDKAVPDYRRKMKENIVKTGIEKYCQQANIDPCLGKDLFSFLKSHEKEEED